jgi:hypothetical protein
MLAMLHNLHYQQGEKRLMLAVLKDALGCIEHYLNHPKTQSWPACRVALQWILSRDHTWPFSFENICRALDFDAARLRSAVCTPLLPILIANPANKYLPRV